MALGVLYIRSANNNNDPVFDETCNEFLKSVSQVLGEELFIANEQTFIEQPVHVFFVASGGSEQEFAKNYQRIKGSCYLLTRQSHNSLAASMEILAFLNENGLKGEIIHGDLDFIGKRLSLIIRANIVKERLKSYRLGTTGESSWLIASKPDDKVMETTSGMKLVNIPFDEVLAEVKQKKYAENAFTEGIKKHAYDRSEIERALEVYGAIQRLVDRYSLKGITVRCFDLLQPTCITGCLALGILNAEGIYAACEGDGRSLISMTVLGELSGMPVFMANPSKIDPVKNEIVFAHCILPINMPTQYRLTTHFESGLGISVAGELPLDTCTIFKCKENFTEYHVQTGRIQENLNETNLCRTQIRVSLQEPPSYFFTQPIANHQMICMGDHKTMIDEFFRLF
ncbi:MAG: hypothetical protein KKC20_25095 [Proteobacteria bacterium]|nr:hypothetical protein [Pseudomonadota bacterium]